MAVIHYSQSDAQQFNLYDAEAEAGEHRDIVHYATKEQARAFVDRVAASPEWKALGGRQDIKIVWTRHDSGIATCYASKYQICLPGWAYDQRVILHEMAHLVTHDKHGPIFAGTALMLYRKFITARFADAQETSYEKYGVKFKRRRFRYGSSTTHD